MRPTSLDRLHHVLVQDEERQRYEKEETAKRQLALSQLQSKIRSLWKAALIPSETAWIRPITSDLYRCPLSTLQTMLVPWNSLPKSIQSKLKPPNDDGAVVEVPLIFMVPQSEETTGKSSNTLQQRPLGGNLTNKLQEYTRGATGKIKPFKPGGIDDTIHTATSEHISPDEIQRAQQVLEKGSDMSWRDGTLITAPPSIDFDVGLSWKHLYGEHIPKGFDNFSQNEVEEDTTQLETPYACDYQITPSASNTYRPFSLGKMWEKSFFDDDSLFGESSADDASDSDESEKDDEATNGLVVEILSVSGDEPSIPLLGGEVVVPTEAHEVDDLLAQLAITAGPRQRKLIRPDLGNHLELAQQHAAMAEDAERKAWAVTELLPIDDFNSLIPNPAMAFPFTLDDFQQQAVARLERSESIFVAAHTSAGKTVCAEYAVALCRQHCTRAIYTSPIKALSNQKFRDFCKKFGSENVGLVTGDLQLNVDDSTCLIMTTEILRSMLYRGADLIRDIEWVIFDEVHYVNDTERGVVWEEVIIMLPQYVNLIFLSATTPNTIEFSDWIGRTKRKPVHVIRTDYRPVPLSHFLWAGLKLHLIMEGKSGFLEKGYKEASKALQPSKDSKDQEKQKSKSSARGGHARTGSKNMAWQQQGDKNNWMSLIRFLEKEGLTPVVVFSFSKKKCEDIAHMLRSLDLNTAAERSAIHSFTSQAIARLSPNDACLPQVRSLCEMVKKGIGVVSVLL
jgi:hypothetical protein